MSGRQKKYLDDLLAEEPATPAPVPQKSSGQRDRPLTSSTLEERAPLSASRRPRGESSTLLGRESALARVASGEVKQVTQLLLDPAKVRIWPGNARRYDELNETSCADLIDSILAEGGQRVPAIVRRVDGDARYEYEVVAGTRRHWTIAWLRANNYPDMKFLAQVHELDDESAFRVADVENRARKDVTDLERARNYAKALPAYYGNHLTRMAERLKLSKGWLSKMIKVAGLPSDVVAAYPSEDSIKLKPAYPLAQALEDDDQVAKILAAAKSLAEEQLKRRNNRTTPISAPEVTKKLLEAGKANAPADQRYVVRTGDGRPAITVLSSNRQGVTLRLHAGTGLDEDAIAERVRDALAHLNETGRGLSR
ncbi:MAG: ParB/RepB/Spo0J family partition protein [Pseudomonadota bacterium]